jgi:CSLREA domain-containing protein
MRRFVLVTTGLALLLCLVAPPTSAVREPNRALQPPDYIVSSTADPGLDGTCDTTECTLREAITAANFNTGTSNIAFSIPPSDSGCNSSTGVCTIQLTSALPALSDGATAIMGSTQTGNRGDTNPYGPEIEVNGASAYDCFDIRSANNTIEGMAINECKYGIMLANSDAHDNVIRGNYIGLDAQGTAAAGNTQDGIYIADYASENTIGGDTASDRNIISGNGWRGIDIYGAGADRNLIKNNFIGADSTGHLAVGNAWNGVQICGGAQDNQIGPNNVIAYNGGGVYIGGSTTISNTVTQNSIHSNLGKGITLFDGANGNLAAPYDVVGLCAGGGADSGADLQWEAFSDFDGEGRFYESTGGTSTGSFTFWPADVLFRYPYVTVTVMDASGNTSEFSDSVPSGCLFRYLPIGMKRY